MARKTVNVNNPFSTSRDGETAPAYFDGDAVWVLDPVAGHYTSNHSLTKAQVAFVARMTGVGVVSKLERLEARNAAATIVGSVVGDAQEREAELALAGAIVTHRTGEKLYRLPHGGASESFRDALREWCREAVQNGARVHPGSVSLA